MGMSRQSLELLGRIRDAHKLQDPIAKHVIDVVKLLREEAKEDLVSAEGTGMLQLQGQARLLQQILRELTTTPPHIRPE